MDDKHPANGNTAKDNAPTRARSRSLSMHEDVPVWYDCCSCEAEPYWAELAEQADAKPGAEPAGAGTEPPRRGE